MQNPGIFPFYTYGTYVKLRTFQKNTYFQKYLLSKLRTFKILYFQNYVLFKKIRTFQNYVLFSEFRAFSKLPCF